MGRLQDINSLPLPSTIAEVYELVPDYARLSNGLPVLSRTNINPELLAIFDYIYYKHYLYATDIRYEINPSTKSEGNLRDLLKVFNVPFPDSIDYDGLKRLVRSLATIWKFKTTLYGYYAWLKAIFGDWFNFDIIVFRNSTDYFAYTGISSELRGYTPTSDVTNNEGRYSPKGSAVYGVVITLYSYISDRDINYIKYTIQEFIPFWNNTSTLTVIKKF